MTANLLKTTRSSYKYNGNKVKEGNGMGGVWGIGNQVKVLGMDNDFKILSYSFILGGFVEIILESPEGGRFFLKRRRSQIIDIGDESIFDADSNDKK
jgi:hypothetical protein